MFHTVAFSMALTTTNVGTLVTPVVDPTVTITGNNLLIPDKLNMFFGAIPFTTTGTAPTTAQIQTPSLRETFFPTLSPAIAQATPDVNAFIPDQFDSPIQLKTAEGMNYQSDALSTTTAGQQGAIVFLADGKRNPAVNSSIFTIRATAAITQVANSWVNGVLTFGQSLPVGNYDVVGMRVEAAGLLAARLVFVGPSAIVRPGCPGNASGTTRDVIDFRRGRLGVWGTFYSVTPPSLEVLGATGTSQVVYLDLVPR